MKQRDVELGGRYRAKVSGNVVTVRLLSYSKHGGWDAVSEATGLVARKHGRRSILIELSSEYCGLVAGRTQQLSLEAEPA